MKPRYSRESLHRALTHHETTGLVEFVGPPSAGDPTWRIRVKGGDTQVFTAAQTYAVCLTLAALEPQLVPR